MTYLNSISINQYRGLTNVEIDGFQSANLITGENNVGKTTLLEALYIIAHSCSSVDSLITAIHNIEFLRNTLANTLLNSPEGVVDKAQDFALKSDANINTVIFCHNIQNATKEYSIITDSAQVRVNESKFNVNFSTCANIEYINKYSNQDMAQLRRTYMAVQRVDEETTIKYYVQEFDSLIEDFKVFGNKPRIKIKDVYRDLGNSGEGLKHFVNVICAIYACADGILFVDDIAANIHSRNRELFFDAIATLSKKYNCQIFATSNDNLATDRWSTSQFEYGFCDVNTINMLREGLEVNICHI